ncbi:AI-2E family transporter [Aureimonas jatrophae]|jgi:predicted PurR-regulated permease PerM|uniref:Predicted PurR-regulated permease PerM n=1 Tax=Aureimonas jatrophae TaxID=1166073 RepID=A0A1H0GBW4_9HYPH|nr:Predicted PurR-regulated permease PerM [Aureimonas jatrophae]
MMSRDRSRLLQRQILFWSLSAGLFVVFLWIFRGILLPFVLGMVMAYFLDPIADWLERRGLSRLLASIAILVTFIVVFVLVLLILVPVISGQIASFVERLPQYLGRLQELAVDLRNGPLSRFVEGSEQTLQQDFQAVVRQLSGFVTGLVASLWTSSLALVNFVSLFVVTPVVAFYLLLDWDRMIASVDAMVPRQYVTTVRRLARDIDRSVAGFVRGQGSVCLILGTYYAVGLTLVGLNFGLLIGFFAGVISFIPYVGSAVGLVIALGVALVQFAPDWIWVAATLGVFFTGQFVEGNILQPKLVGASVGLHPVWLMFALFAFGAIFGFVGLLIAVPAAAAVGVLVRFAIHQYMGSEMYYGRPLEVTPAGRALESERSETALRNQLDPGPRRD